MKREEEEEEKAAKDIENGWEKKEIKKAAPVDTHTHTHTHTRRRGLKTRKKQDETMFLTDAFSSP